MLLSLWNTVKVEGKDSDIGSDIWNERDGTPKMATMVETPPPQLITTIEWSMIDKSRFYPLYTLSSFTGKQ